MLPSILHATDALEGMCFSCRGAYWTHFLTSQPQHLKASQIISIVFHQGPSSDFSSCCSSTSSAIGNCGAFAILMLRWGLLPVATQLYPIMLSVRLHHHDGRIFGLLTSSVRHRQISKCIDAANPNWALCRSCTFPKWAIHRTCNKYVLNSHLSMYVLTPISSEDKIA